MKVRKHRRLVKRLVLSLAVFAALAPTAQARVDEIGALQAREQARTVRPDDQATRFSLTDSVGQLAVRPDDRETRFSPTDSVGQLAVRPDDRSLRPMVGYAHDGLGRPVLVELPEGPKYEGPADIVAAGDGFDWADAGIGAGTVFGAVLLAGIGTLLVRDRKLASA